MFYFRENMSLLNCFCFTVRDDVVSFPVNRKENVHTKINPSLDHNRLLNVTVDIEVFLFWFYQGMPVANPAPQKPTVYKKPECHNNSNMEHKRQEYTYNIFHYIPFILSSSIFSPNQIEMLLHFKHDHRHATQSS